MVQPISYFPPSLNTGILTVAFLRTCNDRIQELCSKMLLDSNLPMQATACTWPSLAWVRAHSQHLWGLCSRRHQNGCPQVLAADCGPEKPGSISCPPTLLQRFSGVRCSPGDPLPWSPRWGCENLCPLRSGNPRAPGPPSPLSSPYLSRTKGEAVSAPGPQDKLSGGQEKGRR